MRFWFQVPALVALLVVAHLGVLHVTGSRAEYAEANVVVNEIKWQRFQQNRDAAVVVVGSSIAGRLPAGALTGDPRGAVNLGLDGASPAFGAGLLLEEQVFPPVLLVEANTLTLPPSQNERTLRATFRSFKNALARELPFLRAENRPVSVAYSFLKERSDRRAGGPGAHPPLDQAVLARAQQGRVAGADPGQVGEAAAWLETVRRFEERGTRVVLVMLPDGGADRAAAYAVARRLAATGVPFIDLKGAVSERAFTYSDGIHLVRPAAGAIAAWLAPLLDGAAGSGGR